MTTLKGMSTRIREETGMVTSVEVITVEGKVIAQGRDHTSELDARQ